MNSETSTDLNTSNLHPTLGCGIPLVSGLTEQKDGAYAG